MTYVYVGDKDFITRLQNEDQNREDEKMYKEWEKIELKDIEKLQKQTQKAISRELKMQEILKKEENKQGCVISGGKTKRSNKRSNKRSKKARKSKKGKKTRKY